MSNQRLTSCLTSEQALDRIVKMVEDIVLPMLAFPGELRSETATADDAIVYRLRVSPDDLAKITGREGRIAASLRSVVAALSITHSLHILLEIVSTEHVDD